MEYYESVKFVAPHSEQLANYWAPVKRPAPHRELVLDEGRDPSTLVAGVEGTAMGSVAKEATQSDGKQRRSHNRLPAVLDAGAGLFANKGYKATTMRDIASETGMLPGSLYYHFASKQDLLLEIYKQAVSDIQQRLDIARDAHSDPWDRFEAAVIAHIEAILDENNYAKVMVGVLPEDAPDISAELTALRDAYEQSFIELIDELPLDKSVDRKMLRLMVLGASNATQLWYSKGDHSPTDIGREFVKLLRKPLD